MKPRDPHGMAPDKSRCVLLLIDVINDFDFPLSHQLLRFALPAARRIAALKKRLRARGVPTIYVNDNFGRWQSDLRSRSDQENRKEAA
jgi:nicotinamidase-related amidase